jgi:nucleoside phosphorylase
MGREIAGADRVDVLIVTAIKLEYDAVLAVHTGALARSEWEERPGPTGLKVAFRTFNARGGGTLRVAVTRALRMGGEHAVNAAAPLIDAYGVRCVAMCGVCAGRRGDVNLGDVVIADQLWKYDAGKEKVETVDGRRVKRVQGETITYGLPVEWQQPAEDFEPDRTQAWLAKRPRGHEAQGDWILASIANGEDPREKSAERAAKCPDYGKAIGLLWKKKWLKQGTRDLTPLGRKYIRELLEREPDGLREPARFEVHVGAIGTGSKVVEDSRIFGKLSRVMRKVLGLEMEGAAVAALAHLRQLRYMIVMKGVMDHADSFKSDNFKAFAATASAECLIAFLRENLPVARDPLEGLLDPGTAKLPEEAGPAALLNARHTVVDFVGREEPLAELRAFWEGEKLVDARLVYGAGGMGKTRLLMELCKRLGEEKAWRAGFVPKDLTPDQFAELAASERPTLAVIDYAESRPGLKALLEKVQGKKLGKLRIVLLARNAGDWLASLCETSAFVKDLLSAHGPLELAALATTDDSRIEAFQNAIKGFARAQGTAPPTTAGPNLNDPRYSRVLYVHMAALATVQGRPVTAATLLDDTLDHEQRFWLTRFPDIDSLDEQLLTEKIGRAIAALTLVGGAPDRPAAKKIVTQATGAPDDKLTLFLHTLYPGNQRTAGKTVYAGGLEPDLLGEAMVLRTLTKEQTEAGPYLDRVFEGADPGALRTGFEVLGRLSGDHPKAREWISLILDRDVAARALPAFQAALAIVEDDSTGERAAHSRLGLHLASALTREGTLAIALEMEAAGLPERTISLSLREVRLWVTETRLLHLPESAEEERARRLTILGARHRDLGHREAAVASTHKAVELYHKMAAARPDAFLHDLAMSLNNLGTMQSELGQQEAALASTHEAVNLYRKVAPARPEAFLPDLATSLNNLGTKQSELGQHEAALASTREAVDLYRKLATARPDAFLPALAMSLTNLGLGQSELGQHEAALASTREAADLRRKLATERPDAFLPDLTESLTNLGIRQSELGQHEAALASAHEAVDLRRKLATARPDAFLPALAMSLTNLGAIQNAQGQREAALASAQEALDALWPYFLALPAAHERLAKMMLGNQRFLHKILGRELPPDLLARIAIHRDISPKSDPEGR